MMTTPHGLALAAAPDDGDLAIARATPLRPILPLAEQRLGLAAEALIPYGHQIAKLSHATLASLGERPPGRLVLVSAMSPTPAGEGKTTTSVGLCDALNRRGISAAVCLREPSLGPCFGLKGGAAGGGRAQVGPMEAINLHFTGDFHAITAAHNLLAALLDNHLYWGNALAIDPERVVWTRVLDMNDRALRRIEVGGGTDSRAVPRESGFEITAASEVMAILCLAEDLDDLERRLGRIVVAWRRDDTPVTAADLEAQGAMAVLLKEAFQPNLVQTLEHNPAFVHGGPFGNIAHGCNSLAATRAALALSEVVVTEAGFGADLGAEKFIDIKGRQAGLYPDAAVLVATLRALKYHGGAAREALGEPDAGALEAGLANLDRHLSILRRFGLEPVVALNVFAGDSAAELARVEAHGRDLGATVVTCRHWAEGGAGAETLAAEVVSRLQGEAPRVAPLYGDDLPLAEKLECIARELYGAVGIDLSPAAREQLARFTAAGYGHLPVCIAKTPFSFSDDPRCLGAPEGHRLSIREARLSAGAGFVVALCGEILTLPGLPREPAAQGMGLDGQGHIEGLF
ncbi:formate--tetrahydrofolate ligase [Halomonas sp. NCCP-2165]|nr:formate--tetrahydrofolate ligase [Halomonas sp. NCCP-2165]